MTQAPLSVSQGDNASLEDETLRGLAERFCLPLSTVVDAKETFEEYCAIDAVTPSTAAEDVTLALPSGEAAQTAPCDASAAAPGLGVRGLQACLRDMGEPKTTSEVRRMIHALVDVPDVLLRLHAQERAAQMVVAPPQQGGDPDVKESGSEEPPGSSPAAITSSGAPRASLAAKLPPPATPSRYSSAAGTGAHAEANVTQPAGREWLSFPEFLHLVRSPCLGGPASGLDAAPSRDTEAEARAVFHCLDADGDGALTEADIRAALAELLLERATGAPSALANHQSLLKVAAMHPVELRAALDECDVDADGVVSVADYISLTHS